MKFPVMILTVVFMLFLSVLLAQNNLKENLSINYVTQDLNNSIIGYPGEMASLLISNKQMKSTSHDILSVSNRKDSFLKNQVIAHRGAWKNTGTPQNSVGSLKAAIDMGCAGSEADLHMTKDGKLIMNHDPDVDGIHIQITDYKDLKHIRLSNGERLPLLEDFLKIIKAQNATRLILEIKTSQKGPEWAKETVRKVIDAVHKKKVQDWMAYISFDYEICKEILKLEPTANVQYLNGDKSPEQLKADGIKGADYHYTVFQKKPEWIQSAKMNQIDLNAWTVNKSADMKWLLDNGFEYITTDQPELLFKEIKKAQNNK
ncbi:MAG: glycerophosphodiester phosphodiesterase family protein [Ginsengibacter sp.]